MHVGKLMARLNVKNVRFDVGSGGIPELTPQDVAAALGYVEDGIGREMLCQVWWPDGAKLTERHLLEILAEAQRLEWQRREDAMLNAMLAVAAHGNKAQMLYAKAHGDRWPRMAWMEQGIPVPAQGYTRVRRAVIDEMKGAGLCSGCNGRAYRSNDTGALCLCPLCLGSGHRPISERSRAEACGVSWMGYRKGWDRVYEWTMALCTESMRRASQQFHDGLGTVRVPN